MRLLLTALVALSLGGWTAAERPIDLAKIDRTVKKEPAYEAKPRYCLLALGPKADKRVWLVMAGERLYVDAKGTGDLTAAERVNPEPVSLPGAAEPGQKGPRFLKYPCAVTKDVTVEVITVDGKLGQVGVRDARRKLELAADRDEHGMLAFSDRPATAPVLHPDGRLAVRVPPGFYLRRGGQEAQLTVHIGTPGLGAGAALLIDCESVPQGLHPVADVEFPARDGGKATRVRCVLDRRC